VPTSTTIPAGWKAVSRVADIDGDVHYLDFGGRDGDPPFVLVHGLGGAHVNWGLLGPLLATHTRTYAPDLAGFGLTHPGTRSGTVQANAALLDGFLRTVTGTPVILVGNSMGGMISLIHAAAHPESVAGLVLLDPAVPRSRATPTDWQVVTTFARYAIPGLGERFLRRRRLATPAAQLVADTYALCCPRPEDIPGEMVDAAVALVEARATEPGLDRAYLQAARSLLRFGSRSRAYYALMAALPMPVLLLHGDRDRLIPIESAREVAAHAPRWSFEELPGIGHLPMIEVPGLVEDRILAWRAGAIGAPSTDR